MWDWLVSFVFFLSQSNARISRIQVRVCNVRRLVAFGYDVPFEDRSDSGMCRSKIGCIRVCADQRLNAFGCVPIKDWMHSGVCSLKIDGFQSCIVRGLVVCVPYYFADIRVCVIASAVKSKKIRNHFCLIMGLGGVFFNQIIRVSKIS